MLKKSTIVRTKTSKDPSETSRRHPSSASVLRRMSSVWFVFGLIWIATRVGASPSPPDILKPTEPTSAEMLEPLAIDDEMKHWLESTMSRRAGPERRLEALAAALLDGRGLGDVLFPKSTPTAIEAFRSRSANCVGFALLFVALAREADVPAFFVVIPQRRDGARTDDLRIIEDHLAAGAMIGGRLLLYDLGGRIRRPPTASRPVSDLTALAVFQSNRGTELLASGRIREALARLELATQLDPELAAAWVNLGVAKRRAGDLAGAESAYRRALELDPRHPGARDNLVNLLHLYGRLEEAATLSVETVRPDPLDALSQAATRLERGELAAARTLYLKALALSR